MGVRRFKADLHIHSVLSPCGDYNLAPGPIPEEAQKKNLDLIAITDHNSGENVNAFQEAFQDSGITILPGMEVTTEEETHILTLFDDIETLFAWQEIVYASLPSLKNKEEVFGVQVEVDATNEIVRIHDRFFAGTTRLSVDAVVSQVHALGGLCIPAHIDKPVFSVISQLGAIPQDLEILAVEIYRTRNLEDAVRQFPDISRYGIVRNSDAHYLKDIGTATTMYTLETPTIEELRKAFLHIDGRHFTTEHHVT